MPNPKRSEAMFNIQDPSFFGNKLLHEALLEACNVAIYGAGAYMPMLLRAA